MSCRGTLCFKRYLLLWGLMLLLPAMPVHAAPKAKTPVKTISVAPKHQLPPGAISAVEALKRIETLEKTVQEQWDMRRQSYDKEAGKTLKAAFDKNGVPEPAMQYVSSWSGNGLYLVWLHEAQPYYKRHADALYESKRPLMMGERKYLSAQDMAYLEQGVSIWKEKEFDVSLAVAEYANTLAVKARFLGEAMMVRGDKCYYNINCPGYQDRMRPIAESYDRQAKAEESRIDQAKARVKEVGAWHVFSAITAQDRIPVTESDVKSVQAGPSF